MVKNGLYAALLTPFSEDGEQLALDALGRLVVHNMSAGLDGAYVGGSTGEAFLLDEGERVRVLAAVAEARTGSFSLIAQVGDPNPAVSRRLATEAARLGYDAVSAVAPFYYKYSQPEILAHYRELAAATDLPFIIYNFPAFSGITLSVGHLAELLNLPNVVGVKNTSPDYYAFERLRALVPGKLLFNGFDETMLCGLVCGADGGIGSTYNVQGGTFVKLLKAFREGRLDDARALQRNINAVIEVLLEHGVFQSLKYLLSLQGVSMGACRKPFAPLEKRAIEGLERLAAILADPPAAAIATVR